MPQYIVVKMTIKLVFYLQFKRREKNDRDLSHRFKFDL